MKVGIGIGVALLVAIGAFFGLREVLSDPVGPDEAAADAIEAFEADSGELEDRLDEENIDLSGEESFDGGEWSYSLDSSEVPEEADGDSLSTDIPAEATIELPASAGIAERDLLVFGGETEATLTPTVTLELVADDGWEVEGATIEDPYPRPPQPTDAELGSAGAVAEDAADAALSLAGPGVYVQPPVYATPEDATEQELIDARAQNDQSYPPYLVSIPGRTLITGPVDRALVLAMGGCEYSTATAALEGELIAADEAADPPGHLQVAEFTGSAVVRPNDIDCRRGRPPVTPIPVDFRVQTARSRLGADSSWHVTRLALQFPFASGSSEPRDVYNVAADVVGDERSAPEFMGAE